MHPTTIQHIFDLMANHTPYLAEMSIDSEDDKVYIQLLCEDEETGETYGYECLGLSRWRVPSEVLEAVTAYVKARG